MLYKTQATDTFKEVTMNRISFIAQQYKIVLSLMILCLLIVNPRAYGSDISDSDLEARVENLSSIIDMRYTTDVQKHIRNYTKYNRKGTEIVLGRATLFFPMFENILRDKNLPADLKYLAIIESSLKPTATSKVGAAGLWQFMKGTGRMMGLKVNSTIDERRDPVKSTEAAAEYLQYLHSKFGDWTLALAAYNCGPGNVRKAIRKSGGKRSFWEIKKYLPKETRNYVPKFIAVTYVMNYYYDHGISPAAQEDHFINTSSAQVYDKVNLRSISKQYNVSLDIVKQLNPAYLKNYIPATKDGRHQLTLPTDEMIAFVNAIQTATLLARAYSLKKEPSISDKETVKEEVRPHISIEKLPTTYNKSESGQAPLISVTKVRATYNRRNYYSTTRLRIRESLKDVANRTGFTLDQLLDVNAFSDENPLVVGSDIRLPAIK